LIRESIQKRNPTHDGEKQIAFCESRMAIISRNPDRIKALGSFLTTSTGVTDSELLGWALNQLRNIGSPQAEAEAQRFADEIENLPDGSTLKNALWNASRFAVWRHPNTNEASKMIASIKHANLGVLGMLFARLVLPQTTQSNAYSPDASSPKKAAPSAPPRRVFTNQNGAFSFSRLPAGRYVLCAQVAAAEPAPANSPWVDTCVWGSAQPPLTLAAGHQLAGIVFTAPKGAWLNLQVADPDQILPQPATKGPAPLSPRPLSLPRRRRPELPGRDPAENRRRREAHQHAGQRLRRQ
jgi:hypothetical protein